MKKILRLSAAALLFSSAAYASPLTLGTGSETGLYFVAGNAICQAVNKEIPASCQALASEASLDNLHKIAQGQLSFGIVQSDWQYSAYHGTGAFEGRKNEQLRAVFSIYPEPFTLITHQDSSVQTLDDLVGKRVNIGVDGSGTQATMQVLMNAKGWTASSFKEAAKLPPAEMATALCNKQIDVTSYNVGHPNSAIKDTAQNCDIRFIPVQGAVVESLISAYPYYAKAQIPANSYLNQPQAVDSFGVYATLVTSSEVSEEAVYQTVKAVFENFDRFKKSHPAFAHLSEQEMVKKALSAPLHQGAEKYYRERGWL